MATEKMKLTILGSGTMMPTKQRFPSGYLLEVDDQKILFDCGHTAVSRLVELGVNLHEIEPIGITHFHTDHFSGCFPLIHARWVDDTMNQRDHRPVTVIGPAGIKERFKIWRTIFWPEAGEKYPIKFIEGAPQDDNLTISTFPVNHVKWFKSVGYRINDTLAYTGDCGSDQSPEFYVGIRNVQTLLVEAGSLTPKSNHFTAEQAAQIAQKYGIQRIILTHIRDEHLPYIQKIIAQYPDLLTIAEDLQTYEI